MSNHQPDMPPDMLDRPSHPQGAPGRPVTPKRRAPGASAASSMAKRSARRTAELRDATALALGTWDG